MTPLKKIKLILLSTLILNSCSSTKELRLEASEDQKTYSKLIEIPGKNSNDIYKNVNEWMILTFNDAESVIQFQDKESGKVMGKYIGEYKKSESEFRKFKCVISIDIKDEKVRIQFLDPQWYKITEIGNDWLQVKYSDTMEKIILKWEELSTDLQNYLIKSEDW